MRSYSKRFLTVAAMLLMAATARAAQEDYAAMTTAAGEIARQMDFFRELYGTDSRLRMLGGLIDQALDFQKALVDFRMNVVNKAPREQIYIAFDNVERKLNAILDEVKAAERDDAALRLVCRRLRAAENDLHFAVYAGDATAPGLSQRLYRQTLNQEAYIDRLANAVDYVLAGSNDLRDWQNDLKELRQTFVSFKRLQERKGPAPVELKQQFLAAETAWARIVERYEGLIQNKLLLQPAVALVDHTFARMAPLAGVSDRRAPVIDVLRH